MVAHYLSPWPIVCAGLEFGRAVKDPVSHSVEYVRKLMGSCVMSLFRLREVCQHCGPRKHHGAPGIRLSKDCRFVLGVSVYVWIYNDLRESVIIRYIQVQNQAHCAGRDDYSHLVSDYHPPCWGEVFLIREYLNELKELLQ